ncbi:MAG: hypothetical protein JNM36_04180 [Chitinophagales bacterium]|nr:hypothetical protein [Chitinophagales bacterium]
MSSSNQFVPNDYKYNNKEYIDDLSLNMLDYGARLLDPLTGRWNGVDALAERYHSSSGYGYVAGNPVLMVDPDGMRNMVYVVFLPSSGLGTMEQDIVVREMQGMFNDALGIQNVKVQNFAEHGSVNMAHSWLLDDTDSFVLIGSHSDVTRYAQFTGRDKKFLTGPPTERNSPDAAKIYETLADWDKHNYDLPELSENPGSFVGVDIASVGHYKGEKYTEIALYAVHGVGHNVHIDHQRESQYGSANAYAPNGSIMISGEVTLGEVKNANTSLRNYIYNNTEANKLLGQYYAKNSRFHETPQDNYRNNMVKYLLKLNNR